MISVCFALVILYFACVLIDCWFVHSREADAAKAFGVIFIVISIFGIVAVNNGFNIPTDFPTIKARLSQKD